jgi:CubicO group peptidase (beta-lactamase class C family)
MFVKTLLLRTALALACALPFQASAQQDASKPLAVPHDALRLLDLWFDAQRDYERQPGISAGVVMGQQLVWKKGYGFLDAAGKVPAAADTLYSICSISKLFTAVAVMQLWEAGKLSLDDDVAKHVPEFAIQRSDADSGPINLRSLLTHSSGLQREADLPYWSASRFPDRAALYRQISQDKTFTYASHRFQYSNLGMSVLGDVVAAASGMPYEAYVQSRILQPLGMKDTQAGLPLPLLGTRLAQGFGSLRRDGTRMQLPPFDTAAITPAAGYVSTVEDLARFAMWQLRLLEKGGSELLKVSTLRDMQRVQWQDADGRNTWGLGFIVQRDGTVTGVGHDGLCPGYRTAVILLPKEKLAVIGMANAVGNGSAPFTRPMRQVLLKGLRLTAPKDNKELDRQRSISGRYGNNWGSEGVVVPWGEGLAMLSLPSSDPAASLQVLKHSSGDTYRFVDDTGNPGTPVLFTRDAAGHVTGYVHNGQHTSRNRPLPEGLAP